VKSTGATRAGRPKSRGLPFTLGLLGVTGLACTVQVDLPSVVAADASASPDEAGGISGDDASVNVSVDVAVDVSALVAVDASMDSLRPDDKPGFHGGDQCGNPHDVGLKSNSVEVIVALDRSLSMQNVPFDSTTRLDAAIQAIVGLIAAHTRVQFDIELFPGSQDCGGLACCAGSPASVQPGSRNSTSLESQLVCGTGDSACPNQGNNSPSHIALQKCRHYFANQTAPGFVSQVVLLVTDQDPTCEGDAFTNDGLCSQADGEAARLRDAGVQTFVVSLSDDASSTSCLKTIAAGSAPNSSQLFVAVTGQAALQAAFANIMSSVEADLCRFYLARPPNSSRPITVTLNDQPVPPAGSSGQDGWTYDPSSRGLVLSGKFCSAADSTSPVVQDCWP